MAESYFSFPLQLMLNENKRVRAKIQPTFEQLAMLHVAKVISSISSFTHVNKEHKEVWFQAMSLEIFEIREKLRKNANFLTPVPCKTANWAQCCTPKIKLLAI